MPYYKMHTYTIHLCFYTNICHDYKILLYWLVWPVDLNSWLIYQQTDKQKTWVDLLPAQVFGESIYIRRLIFAVSNIVQYFRFELVLDWKYQFLEK